MPLKPRSIGGVLLLDAKNSHKIRSPYFHAVHQPRCRPQPQMTPTSAANPVSCGMLPAPILKARHGPAQVSDPSRWFAENIQPHEFELRAYLRGQFPSIRDVDDLVQETYARIFRAREVGKATLTRAYLFVTARNIALDRLRHEKIISIESIAEIDQLAVVEGGPDAAEATCRNQELEILAEAVATLPSRCREILILRRYHELSHKQIAERLNIAVNTVNAQLVVGMLRCREFLGQRGLD
ncbi:MAG: RNA polymerase sigma factor [Opitutaceae bacterium]